MLVAVAPESDPELLSVPPVPVVKLLNGTVLEPKTIPEEAIDMTVADIAIAEPPILIVWPFTTAEESSSASEILRLEVGLESAIVLEPTTIPEGPSDKTSLDTVIADPPTLKVCTAIVVTLCA